MDDNNKTVMDNITAPSFPFNLPPIPTIPWDVYVIISCVFHIGLCSLISVAGLFTNALVMAVFYKQGIMAESSNISLFALAVADFFIQISHICFSATLIAQFVQHYGIVGTLRIDPLAVEFLVGRPKIILGHINCWLTAYLAFERCFSVLFPFLVKRIFSPKNTLTAVICVYVGSVFTFIPLTFGLGVTEIIRNNKTLVTLFSNGYFTRDIVQIAILANPIILRPIGVGIVVICNMIILVKVQSSRAWRKSVSASNSSSSTKDNADGATNKGGSNNTKETRLVKMISCISAIFLVCTIPDMLVVFLTQSGHTFMFDESVKYTGYAFVFLAESISSSINFFVYYHMSTNFKKIFTQIFGRSNSP